MVARGEFQQAAHRAFIAEAAGIHRGAAGQHQQAARIDLVAAAGQALAERDDASVAECDRARTRERTGDPGAADEQCGRGVVGKNVGGRQFHG